MNVIHLRLLGGVELVARESGRERRLALAPKPLGLLAYLALAEADTRPVRRDVLLAIFWPELSSTRARAALRQALFQLRRAVGENVLDTAGSVIALAPEAISCDVIAFEQCLARGDRAGAMEVYRGPLLHGFFIDGASSELEGWMEHERATFAWKAFLASSALAEEAARSRNGIAAAQWARMAVSLAPDNEIAVRRLIEILDTFGDRAGALRVAGDFSRWLSEEFGSMPSAETRALIAAVRGRAPAADTAEPSSAGASPPAIALPLGTSDAPLELRRDLDPIRHAAPRRPMLSRQRLMVAAGFAIAVSVGALVATRTSHGATPTARGGASGGSPSITIASPVARRLYTEGMSRYLGGDAREGARLFVAALADDSTCAMCAYYAALAYRNFDDENANRMLEAAMRLAPHVSEPERLLIHFQWADATNSVLRGVVAESLVTRYSDWPEAQMAAAVAAQMDGRWLEAAAHLRLAIAAQPPPDSTGGGACTVCSAQLFLAGIYEAADSLPAALRIAQSLVRVRPHSRLGWLELSHVLSESGRYDEARAAMDTSTRYASGTDDDVIEHAQIEIRAGNFTVADRLLTSLAQTGNDNSKFNALWFLVISLRAEGKLHEALQIARGPLRRGETSSTQGIGGSDIAEAQVLFELGQFRRAAAIFARDAFPPDSFARSVIGRVARQRAWTFTHAGSALAAAGDTIALTALIDSVKWWGARSGFGRDPKLFHYLQGLLWMARARPESAVVAFRGAMTSESQGFSRINFQLARALLAMGRGDEAIVVLQHSLAGALEGGNFYASRTDLQDELARAYDAAGKPDSAAVYYRAVLRAWRQADAQFKPAVDGARARLAADERLLESRR